MTQVGRTKDAGWQIGVSGTLPHPPEDVWALLTSPAGLAVWLAPDTVIGTQPGQAYETPEGVRGEIRSYRPLDRIRLTWQREDADHDTTVQVAMRPAAGGRTMLRFHQERMADADERERQRTHWKGVMDRVAAALDAGS